MLVIIIPFLFKVLPSSPWIIKAAVLVRSIPGILNNSKCGWSCSNRFQNSPHKAPAARYSFRGSPASRGHIPVFSIHENQSRGQTQGIFRPSISISLMGISNFDPCFSITFWTSRSELFKWQPDHKVIPHLEAAACPMSVTTAWAVRIWLLHVASGSRRNNNRKGS